MDNHGTDTGCSEYDSLGMLNTNKVDWRRANPLNRPSRDEWMSYLSGEMSRSSRFAFQIHLQSCAVCLQKIGELSRTMQKLDTCESPHSTEAAATSRSPEQHLGD